jgi:hypothetical protein
LEAADRQQNSATFPPQPNRFMLAQSLTKGRPLPALTKRSTQAIQSRASENGRKANNIHIGLLKHNVIRSMFAPR